MRTGIETSVPVFYGRKGTDFEGTKLELQLTEFPDNTHIPEFRNEKSNRLLDDLEESMRSGMSGVLHIGHGGSPTRMMLQHSLPTGITESPNLYRTIQYLTLQQLCNLGVRNDGDFRRHPYGYILVSESGVFTPEQKKKMDDFFQSPTCIILGGGPFSPDHQMYRPIIRRVEKAIKEGIPILGVCLGHEIIANIWGTRGFDVGLQEASLEFNSTVHKITEQGQNHPLTGHLFPEFTTMQANEVSVVCPDNDDRNFGTILSRNIATGWPSAIAWSGTEAPVISVQYHPEIPMDRLGEYYESESVISIGDKIINIHPRISEDLVYIIREYLLSSKHFAYYCDQYGLTTEDVQALLEPRRNPQHLGERFYGPALAYLVSQRMKITTSGATDA